MIPETAKQAIVGWVALDDWHTAHHLALGRYYDLVQALCDEQFMEEDEIRQMIHEEIESHHPDFNQGERAHLVDRFVELAARLYRYRVLRDFRDIRGIGASCWWCP